MPTVGSLTASVSPISQSVSWDKADALPSLTNILIYSSNADSVSFYINFENTAIEWLGLVGYNNYSDINGFIVNQSLPLEFIDANLLQIGNYKATIYFTFSKVDGAIVTKSTIINLTVTETNFLKTEKTNYDVVFNRATNTLSGDTHVNILNNTTALELDFWNQGDVLRPITNFVNGFDLMDNPANLLLANPSLPISGSVLITAKIKDSTGIDLYSFAINVYIFENENITATPNLFEFELLKIANVEKTDILKIINPFGLNFQITEFSSWLVLD